MTSLLELKFRLLKMSVSLSGSASMKVLINSKLILLG